MKVDRVVLSVLRKRSVHVAENGTVSLHIGMYESTSFPLTESVVPESDVPVLLYTHHERGWHILAVDRVYWKRNGGMKTARLFGSVQDVPMISGSAALQTSVEPLTLPYRRYVVSVVRHEDEQLFKSNGVLFDRLPALEVFEDGQLTVLRNGKIVDQTSGIERRGTHAASVCFIGLDELFKTDPSVSQSPWRPTLDPTDFQDGDTLLLDIQVPEAFVLETALREIQAFASVLQKALEEHPKGMPVEALPNEMSTHLPEALQRANTSEVLRLNNL